MRSQFMELKVQWPLANPDIFLSDTAALSCYELRPDGTFSNPVGASLGTIPILRQQRNWVGGVNKWQFLLKFSTIYADVG